MRLMVLTAHPDDAEIWCGGTLILHAEKGDEVHLCILSYTEDSLRGEEAQEAAKMIGCELEFLGLRDTAIRDSDRAVDQLTESLVSFRPNCLITHWYDDIHPDHEAAFYLVRRTLMRTVLVNPQKNVPKLPQIYCCDTYNSHGLRSPFTPDRFVDITDVWERKIAAIKAYKSEPVSFYLSMIENQCKAHGKRAKTKRAEAFLHLPAFSSPEDDSALGVRM
jgi:LmbE family N-acetylglucosaminyl deacetylase